MLRPYFVCDPERDFPIAAVAEHEIFAISNLCPVCTGRQAEPARLRGSGAGECEETGKYPEVFRHTVHIGTFKTFLNKNV
jgi:hypothetical protein